MFKSADLSMFAVVFLIFRNDKPVDWILNDFARTKYCRSDRDPKDCRKAIAAHWLFSRPSLFQHVGTHSSLKGKVQKLKDKNFGKVNLFKAHLDNPPATTFTSLRVYKQFTLDAAYKGDSFFWAYEPSVNDVLAFEFADPQVISGFLLRSGNPEHPEDKFPVNTTVEVLPASSGLAGKAAGDQVADSSAKPADSQSISPASAATAAAAGASDGYRVVGLFKGSGLAEGEVPAEIGPIKSLRIRVNTDSQRWLILSEVCLSLCPSLSCCC